MRSTRKRSGRTNRIHKTFRWIENTSSLKSHLCEKKHNKTETNKKSKNQIQPWDGIHEKKRAVQQTNAGRAIDRQKRSQGTPSDSRRLKAGGTISEKGPSGVGRHLMKVTTYAKRLDGNRETEERHP